MAPCTEKIVLQELFIFMSAFMQVVNRVDRGYGVNTTLNAKERRQHTFKIVKEWPSVIEKLHLEGIYNSELGYDLKEKILTNQEYNLLKVYENIDKTS